MASRQAESKHASIPTAKPSILQTQADQRNRLMDEYFEKTKLLQVIQDFMADMATTYKTQFRLPANPYPELLKTMRMHELRQTFFLQSDSSSSPPVLTALSGQTSTQAKFQVWSVQDKEFALPIWGMKPTLEKLTRANLYTVLELLNSACQGLLIHEEIMNDDCRATAYGVLVGNSLFGAGVQDLQPCFLEIETHVFVSGPYLEKTMTVFARFLLKQLYESSNAAASFASLSPEEVGKYTGCIACDGIILTPPSSSTGVELSPQIDVWTVDRVMENRGAFFNAVNIALVNNTLISINRYDSAVSAKRCCLWQTEQVFFFHAVVDDGRKSGNSKNKASPRSFLVRSRALAGIFFQAEGAMDIAACFRTLEDEDRKKQLKKKQVEGSTIENDIAVHDVRPRFGFVGIFQGAMDELHRIGLSNEVCRLQVSRLVSCFAYNLGYLVEAHQVLDDVICRSKCSSAIIVVVQARFARLKSQMKQYLDEWYIFPPTSIIYPVGSLIRDFYSQVKGASEFQDERQTCEFVEALRCVNDLLLLVIRAVFSDFIRLARTAVVAPARINPQYDITLDEIDVMTALEIAISERKYPPAIVSETIFAQAMIDSCLDVAVESAVMNTVAFRLPPNPYIDMSNNLQVFALRQLMWNQEHEVASPPSIKSLKVGSLELFSIEGKNLYAANPTLLQVAGGDKIIQFHRWLLDHHIFNKGANNSYSMAIVPMILIFHPLLIAMITSNDMENSSSLIKKIDTIEVYVPEGNDVVQARILFEEAVRSDLDRIAAACSSAHSTNSNKYWQLFAKARVHNIHGEIVVELDLSQLITNEIFAGIIEQTANAQLIFQVVVQIAEGQPQDDNSNLSIYEITKTYIFHYHSSDIHNSADSSTLLPPLILFRMAEYGVFFSKENALLCLPSMKFNIDHHKEFEKSRDEWTPYASEAHHRNDTFLLYEIDIVHNITVLQQNCELTDRLVIFSDVCQLYSLEQALRWLLDALQTGLQQTVPSRPRKDDISPKLSPATVSSIYLKVALQIITQMEQLVVPLNHQLLFVHNISDPIATLRNCVTRWQTVQPLTDEQLEIQRKQRDKTPVILTTPREDPEAVTSDLVDSLRTTWILVLFVRFSYQRAFFANAKTNKM